MAPADKADQEDVILNKRNYDNLKDCLAFLPFFQEPPCRLFISVRINYGTQRTVKSLLEKDKGPSLVISSFLQLKLR